MKLSMRRKIIASATAGAALIMLAAGPATAADTTTTFTLTGAGLSVSAPSAAVLSASTLIGVNSLSAALGNVVVTDSRGTLNGSWTAQAASTAFTTPGGGANRTIANTNVFYWSGVATPTIGHIAVPVGQQLTTLQKVALDSAKDAVVTAGVIGTAAVTWNPTVEIAVPTNALAGTYTGTITHSVA
jgi:hypothetical protein